MAEWLRWHSVRAHLLAPIWVRIPEKTRWRIVSLLNRSRSRCWCGLVDAALCWHRDGDDACEIPLPSLRSEKADRCASVCDWSHPDHTGEHPCNCYCGKFDFIAPNGAIDRAANR